MACLSWEAATHRCCHKGPEHCKIWPTVYCVNSMACNQLQELSQTAYCRQKWQLSQGSITINLYLAFLVCSICFSGTDTPT